VDLQVTDQNDKILIIYTRQNFRKNTKERNREQRAACMGVGAGVCVCFVLLIGNLEKKPRSWQRSRWKGEEEETRKVV